MKALRRATPAEAATEIHEIHERAPNRAAPPSPERESGSNRLIHCEASTIGEHLASEVRFDLVYLDPPYGVGTKMTARTRAGETRGRMQTKSGPTAYDDAGRIEPLVAMIVRALRAVRDRMNEGASLYIHLDHRAVHDVKVAADGVFGRSAFLGEIIWVPGNGGRGASLSVTHQTILVYARSGKDRGCVAFHYDDPALREPYADTSLSMHFSSVDPDGRRYRERNIAGKSYRYYADRGRRIGSVWTDIPAMVANTPLRKEATGYPTQKPEKLLERIIRVSSAPGDTVVDPMCGSGTTLVVAAKLGRCFIGGDASALAIETSSKRLELGRIPFE